MSEIAGILGFGSVYYFSRVFKDMVGIPPLTFAKKIRGADSKMPAGHRSAGIGAGIDTEIG